MKHKTCKDGIHHIDDNWICCDCGVDTYGDFLQDVIKSGAMETKEKVIIVGDEEVRHEN